MKRVLIFLFFIFTILSINAQEVIVFEDNFNDNSNGWAVGGGSEISGGSYTITNNTDGAGVINKVIERFESDVNYSIEFRVRQISGEIDKSYGLLYSMLENSDMFYDQFSITSKGTYKVSSYIQFVGDRVEVEQKTRTIAKGLFKYNVIKIERVANTMNYYINGKIVYRGNSGTTTYPRIAFYVDSRMKVEIDWLKVKKWPRVINIVEGADTIADKVKLSDKINSKYGEIFSIVSADGKTLYVTRADHPENTGAPESDQDIWYSTLDENGEWNELKNMGYPLNNRANNFVISASPDNNSLIVGNTYKSDGSPWQKGLSISYKTQDGNAWEIPQPLKIKKYYNKSTSVGYFLCSDNKTLIISAERRDTYGENDLYVSFLMEDGTWSEPKNMGGVVNSLRAETNPFVAADNKTMYFSSTGHPGYGSYDIFVTKRLDDTWTNWSEPKNLGPKVNTEEAELNYFLDAKGETAYISSSRDIYTIKNAEKTDPVTMVSGVVYNKKSNEAIHAEIRYYDIETNTELGRATSNPKTGAYNIVLPAGKNYSFVAQQKDFFPLSENVNLKDLEVYKEYEKDLYLLPMEKGESIRLNNIFFEFNESSLLPESYNELDRLYNVLKDNPTVIIEVGGHTDDVGSEDYNQTLSESRAEAVMKYLLEKGVQKNRVTAVGYGKLSPLVPNDSEENRAYNRRVEFKVIEN